CLDWKGSGTNAARPGTTRASSGSPGPPPTPPPREPSTL
ncbi:MAG: hypothetical protein AVDCRST_MAG25-2125, partial [uncultured Rubrobacteraceae bacterium]